LAPEEFVFPTSKSEALALFKDFNDETVKNLPADFNDEPPVE